MAHEAFKPIEIGDADLFRSFLRQDPPRVSELTFTNLFMWRKRYSPVWRRWRDCLLTILRPGQGHPFGLQPLGTGDKAGAMGVILEELVRLGADGRGAALGLRTLDPDARFDDDPHETCVS